MRPSSRTLILDAAVRVTEREGITGLTLESTAEEAGLTKGGLLYHFRTREDLLLAIQQHITDQWEEHLLAELGKPFEESTPAERGAAYTRISMHGDTHAADLAFMIEASSHPELAEAWNTLMERWTPDPRSLEPSHLDLFLARLAADGFWLFEATTGVALEEDVRQALRERMDALTSVDEAPPTRQDNA